MDLEQKIRLKTDGLLQVVATPIGNLSDISARALQVLTDSDWIAAEDTRHSKQLCQHFGIKTPLISLHNYNEKERSAELLERLKQGEQGALISDAGTPLISDPGYFFVKLLRENGIKVSPVPGPSAMITALSASGLATNRFSFEGFLPAKNKKRVDVLTALLLEPRTMVFYESPHRLTDSLKNFGEVFEADRRMTVAREMTKKFEQFISGTLAECVAYFEENTDKVRGEFVLMLEGAKMVEESTEQEEDGLIDVLLAQGLPVKQISDIISHYFGVKKKAIYTRVQAKKELLA